MVSSQRSEAVLELGRRLVEQLDTDDDLLTSWMAHYLAELIQASKTATSNDKPAADAACAREIRALWNHRASLPRQVRPLTELDPILKTLARLGGSDAHHLSQQSADTVDKPEEETRRWLARAEQLDQAARELVQYAIQAATRGAASTAKPWLELAKDAGLDLSEAEMSILELLSKEDAPAELFERVAHDQVRRTLSGRLERLEFLIEVATEISNDLRLELGEHNGEG